ncbi:MAG: SIMPL domain-containing protein [Cyanobacteriota bacterium]
MDAIAATGVPADDIQVKITEPRPSALPFPFPSTGSAGGAEVLVTIEQPTRDRLEKIVTAANQAASKNKEISISSVDVQFSTKDCQALEKTAYQAAVQDAQNRARAIAEAMGAKMRRVGSVAEPFYNAYLGGCDSQGNLPFGGDSAASYDPNAPIEVEVTKELFVTFPVE